MADLSINFAGIRSPNPFWLASAPPTNSGAQVHRAFEAGWGGAVWKTIGAPVLNVSNRYGAWHYGGQRMLAINNVELISDRSLEVNLREIRDVKRHWPDRAVIVSAMVESKPEAWREIVLKIEDTGADGIELNYGCPHGMSERGMGSAVGQVPEYCQQITSWVTEVARIPVIVKLTPNVASVVPPARAALAAGAHGLSLINTINSIIGVDLDTFELIPNIGGKGGHGGYAGPAVKPIALNLLSSLGVDEVVRKSGVPISGMGGITTWRDAAEFLLLGATSLQVCTAVMHYGFRIIEDLVDGLNAWMDAKGFKTIAEVVGKSLPRISDFNDFDLSFRAVARINPEKCIRCNLCYVACNDTAHQCIDLVDAQGNVVPPFRYDVHSNGKREALSTRPQPRVREEDCVGCRLCHNVCPVEGCIEMVEVPSGRPPVTWRELMQTRPEVTEDWSAMERYRKEVGIEIH
ncbi:NAD-dependent dihydropyrimidine dehydrogenase subunit PreA [Meiothermus luteus]|jgi:dihydropyrimidine dehydrogenase (NAD+) subunit PreA|uniref:dihydrouracil dehydrogenase (NAD(+)) n=1 Tax=Meiothermus luteus TaxID=2026184 RepID=A0A399EWM0_9DEIN|nr:NAD-dependent dihydropyrimidine dehydrogenase subunit PreA [Meiothermus luteus]RIH86922.1 NAD-dependent dihydropyrimidine dehydrogenase subunit PreA [Meiothermus luteus]RMH55375.1 MAG: NAD-dependent dihydropyrimidine dehydrogenase subunit PreA [Deinococcota bacterium]